MMLRVAAAAKWEVEDGLRRHVDEHSTTAKTN
jgi:hypothetical protein